MKKLTLLFIIAVMTVIPVSGKGMFEFGFHYSTWNVNMIAPLLE